MRHTRNCTSNDRWISVQFFPQPKTKTTQTRVERGTNPKRVHTYIAGLRNGLNTKAASKYAKDKNGQPTKKKTTVVNLTFEL